MADNITQLVKHIKGLSDRIAIAQTKAFIATMMLAESFAKRNVTKNFTGRHNRILTGGLLNSIYSDYKISGNTITGELGTKGITYGAIHEYGGTITPTKAKKLWMPIHANAGKMTPREFFNLKQGNSKQYFLNDNVAGRVRNPVRGKGEKASIIPLFMLLDKVEIPARPYLRPALQDAFDNYGDYLNKFLAE